MTWRLQYQKFRAVGTLGAKGEVAEFRFEFRRILIRSIGFDVTQERLPVDVAKVESTTWSNLTQSNTVGACGMHLSR